MAICVICGEFVIVESESHKRLINKNGVHKIICLSDWANIERRVKSDERRNDNNQH